MRGDKRPARAVQPASGRGRCIPELTQSPGAFDLFIEGDELYRDMLASISGARGHGVRARVSEAVGWTARR